MIKIWDVPPEVWRECAEKWEKVLKEGWSLWAWDQCAMCCWMNDCAGNDDLYGCAICILPRTRFCVEGWRGESLLCPDFSGSNWQNHVKRFIHFCRKSEAMSARRRA